MNKIVRSRSKSDGPYFSLTRNVISNYHDNIRHSLQNKYSKIVVQNKNVHRGRSPRRNNKRTLN